MHVSITLSGIAFQPVNPATTVMGTTKGGWVYAGQRPCYEAKTPAFYTMEQPLTRNDVANAMGEDDEDGNSTPMEALTSYDLSELAQTLMEKADFKAAVADLSGTWDIRALTHAEWLAARNQAVLTLEAGLTERLADGPASNHRGAMMDGRPRPNEVLGPAATQTAAATLRASPRSRARPRPFVLHTGDSTVRATLTLSSLTCDVASVIV